MKHIAERWSVNVADNVWGRNEGLMLNFDLPIYKRDDQGGAMEHSISMLSKKYSTGQKRIHGSSIFIKGQPTPYLQFSTDTWIFQSS